MEGSKKELVLRIVKEMPDINAGVLASMLGSSLSTAYRYRREARKEFGYAPLDKTNRPECRPGWSCLSCRQPDCVCNRPQTSEEQEILNIVRGDRF